MDVIVIGGGAAGMMAALTAAENQDNRVVPVGRGPRRAWPPHDMRQAAGRVFFRRKGR